MKTLKVGICFLDENNKPIVVRPLKSNWSVELGEDIMIPERSYRDRVRDEIVEVLSHQVRMEIHPDIFQEMLEEIGE